MCIRDRADPVEPFLPGRAGIARHDNAQWPAMQARQGFTIHGEGNQRFRSHRLRHRKAARERSLLWLTDLTVRRVMRGIDCALLWPCMLQHVRQPDPGPARATASAEPPLQPVRRRREARAVIAGAFQDSSNRDGLEALTQTFDGPDSRALDLAVDDQPPLCLLYTSRCV